MDTLRLVHRKNGVNLLLYGLAGRELISTGSGGGGKVVVKGKIYFPAKNTAISFLTQRVN